LHHIPSGAWIISDCRKAPYWGISRVIQLLSDARAPRKTLVVGSFSDAPGSTSSKYRKLALEGLEVADRVIFVGDTARFVRKVLTQENNDRLFAFDSIEDAASFLTANTIPEEVILIKSGGREHLERLYHSQSISWRCWKYPCTFPQDCMQCDDNKLNIECT